MFGKKRQSDSKSEFMEIKIIRHLIYDAFERLGDGFSGKCIPINDTWQLVEFALKKLEENKEGHFCACGGEFPKIKAENEKLIEKNTYLQGEIKKIDKHSFCLSRDCATRANTLLLEKAIIEGDLDSIRRELKEIKIEIEHLKAQLQQYGAKPCSACDGEGLFRSLICNYCNGTGVGS